MAAKKGNGHDPGTERIVEVLERLEKNLTGLREEVRATNGRLDALREELHGLRMDLKSSIEVRLAKLEAAVFRPTGT